MFPDGSATGHDPLALQLDDPKLGEQPESIRQRRPPTR